MVKLYKVGDFYYLESKISGVRKRWSLKTRDRIVADTLRRQAELSILAGVEPAKPKLWPDFQEEFLGWVESHVAPKTLKGYRFLVKKFGAFLELQQTSELREITPQTVTKFTDSRRKEIHPSTKRPPTEGSIKFDLRILHRVFAYAIDCEYIEKNPVVARNLAATPGKTMPFSQEDVKAMLADPLLHKMPQLRAIVLIFLHTGLRLGDVIELKRSDIVGDRLIVHTKKRRKDVSLHVHKELLESLAACHDKQNEKQLASPLVFSTTNGTPIRNLDKALKRLFKRAGIKGGHAHRFRDTFAVRLLSKGASLYDVSKLMGITVQTAERHYSPYVEELRQRGADLVKKLDFV